MKRQGGRAFPLKILEGNGSTGDRPLFNSIIIRRRSIILFEHAVCVLPSLDEVPVTVPTVP